MKTRLVIVGAVAALVLALGAGVGFGEDQPAEPEPMSEQEMWAKMAELATPAEMHTDVLARMVGSWTAKGKIFTAMGEMPITGKSENTWILGDRFVQVDYEGPFMGGMFHGMGYIGFDNLSQKFEQTWIMTMATSMDIMTGTWDAETKTLTWLGKAAMPNGVVYAKRTTAEFVSENEFVSKSYASGPDGKEQQEMELTYTRVEEAAE